MDLIADHGACGCGMWDGGVSDPTVKCLVQHITKTREVFGFRRCTGGTEFACLEVTFGAVPSHKCQQEAGTKGLERIILLVLDATPFGLCPECSPFTAFALHWSECLFTCRMDHQ